MHSGYSMQAQCVQMERGRVTLMVVEPILWKQTMQFEHQSIPRGLGKYGSRRNFRYGTVSPYYCARRHGQHRAMQSVYQHLVWRACQPHDGALHGQ